MSDESQTRRDNALDFLDDLDRRHEFLLTELEQLNSRIDAVLGEYAKSRQSAALSSGLPSIEPKHANLPEDASLPETQAADFE